MTRAPQTKITNIEFCLGVVVVVVVELARLELATPCLQIAVIDRVTLPELGG